MLWYVAALASENEELEVLTEDAASTLTVLLAVGWLYSSVASAIDDTETMLKDSA